MEQKILFEIPIYAMSEKEFNKRWNKKKAELYDMFINGGNTEKDAKLYVSDSCFPRCLWKYNQIIGYIRISVSRHDVWFDVYRSLDKIYYATSKQKHFIEDMHANGTHFYVSKQSDKEIKREIREMLKDIEKEHLRKSFYVDYSTFNNIFEYINIQEIMKSM